MNRPERELLITVAKTVGLILEVQLVGGHDWTVRGPAAIKDIEWKIGNLNVRTEAEEK